MPVFKVYIVDDDPRAVRKLSRLVYEHPDLLLAGSHTDPEAAILEIKRYKPDILFLDLEMMPLSGWEVMRRIDADIKVILCTADERAGSQAFEMAARDYLVKPFASARFRRAIERAIGAGTSADPSAPRYRDKGIIYLSAGGAGNVVRIDLRDIEMVEAQGNRSRIFHTYDAILVDQSLKEIQRMLPPGEFRRIHKGFIIAMNRYYRHRHGKAFLINVSHEECKEVPIGDTYAARFYEYVRNTMKDE